MHRINGSAELSLTGIEK